jgi:hypothetical protein
LSDDHQRCMAVAMRDPLRAEPLRDPAAPDEDEQIIQ